MKFPWSRTETRASSEGYTEARLLALLAAADGQPSATAVMEVAAGLWARDSRAPS